MKPKLLPFSQHLEKYRKSESARHQRFIHAIDRELGARQGASMNLSSSDFLGLSFHPYLKQKMLSCKECNQEEIEERLSTLLLTERSLLYNSTASALSGLFSLFQRKDSLLLIDRHASIRFEPFLESLTGKILYFDHLRVDHLEAQLSRFCAAHPIGILVESLSPVLCDIAPLQQLQEIADRYGALLMVDDSTNFGAMGRKGMGLGASRRGADILIGSFGQGRGSFGTYLGLCNTMADYLLHFAPHHRSPLLQSQLAGIEGMLDLLPSMDREREQLLERRIQLASLLKQEGWNIACDPTSHMLSILLSSAEEAVEIASFLADSEIYVSSKHKSVVPSLTLAMNTEIKRSDLPRLTGLLSKFSSVK